MDGLVHLSRPNGGKWVCWATVSKAGHGIIIVSVSKVAGYASDTLEFHHPGSGLEDQA